VVATDFLFDFATHGGWHNRPAAVASVLKTLPLPLARSAAAGLRGTGAGKTVLRRRDSGTP
jgi:hypothetical protein